MGLTLPRLEPWFHPLHRPGPSEDKPDGPLGRAAAEEHGPPDHRRSFLRTMKGSPHPDQMRRPYEVWCSIHPVFFRWIASRFFQSAHSIWMNLYAGGIQTYHIYLDLNNSQLLQPQKYPFQNALFRPAVYPNIDHVPISVFFGQAPPFAPIFHYIQHCIQHVQVTYFRWFPLFGKAFCDLFILFFSYFHSFIITHSCLCEHP